MTKEKHTEIEQRECSDHLYLYLQMCSKTKKEGKNKQRIESNRNIIDKMGNYSITVQILKKQF